MTLIRKKTQLSCCLKFGDQQPCSYMHRPYKRQLGTTVGQGWSAMFPSTQFYCFISASELCCSFVSGSCVLPEQAFQVLPFCAPTPRGPRYFSHLQSKHFLSHSYSPTPSPAHPLLTDSYSKTGSSIFPTLNPSATDLGLIKDTVEVSVCFPSVYLHQHCRKVRPEPGKQRQRENKHQDAIVPTNAQTNKNIKPSDSSHQDTCPSLQLLTTSNQD